MRATLRLSSPAWFAQPEVDVLDRLRLDAGALHGGGDRDRRQIVRAYAAESAPP